MPGSTYELFRTAIRVRREHALGSGGLAWLTGYSESVLAYTNGEVTVVANLGADPVAAPPGARVLLASAELPDDGTIPPDTTAWLTR